LGLDAGLRGEYCLGCRKLTLAEEETVTVKKWYKLNEKAAGGRWELKGVLHGLYNVHQPDTGVGMWLTQGEWERCMVESEMDVEMTAEELAGEREEMRDGN